jgi:hypothetical protein
MVWFEKASSFNALYGICTVDSYTINDCSLASLRTLAREVREDGLYRLPIDPVALLHSSERPTGPSSS